MRLLPTQLLRGRWWAGGAWAFVLLALGMNMRAAETGSLNAGLEFLRPYLNRTWRGELKNSKPEAPQVDVSHWERALNGQAVRILHSINDGVYGGETLVYWDAARKLVAYEYFTTAGYITRGTMAAEEGKVVSRESVSGSAGGVTEVRATTQLRADGTLHVKAEYLKNGEWVPGHEITYREDPQAKVNFK